MIKTEREMREMTEMNKAFNDFDKACQKAIGACNDFIDMDINKTSEVQESTQKIEDATPLPQVTIVHKEYYHGKEIVRDSDGSAVVGWYDDNDGNDYRCRD